MTETIAFDVPRDVILPVESCELRLDLGPHPFARAHSGAIEENWKREKAAKPALFDGEVVMLSRLFYREGRLYGVCHPARYSAFLMWLRLRPVADIHHFYTQAMPVGTDGTLLAIRMGGHTLNAGQVYFASGAFEPWEFPDGRADIEGNMAREVREETGLSLGEAVEVGGLQMLWCESGVVLFRRYFFDRTAVELARDVEAHLRDDRDPEITGPVLISSSAHLPDTAADQMPALVGWHFANPPAP